MAAWPDLQRTHGLLWRIALDAVVIAATPARKGSPREHASAVCLLRLDGIGDFVLWLAAARRLAAHYRDAGARVVLVANAVWADWACELRLADEVWAFDRARFAHDIRYRVHWIRRMRVAGFDTVVQPTHSRRPAEGDALVRASGAPRRIGSAGDSVNSPAWLKRRADRWYTDLVDSGGPDRMELLRNAAFMRGLGFADFRAAPPALGAEPACNAVRNPARFAAGSYAVLVPGAGAAQRAWPAAAFAEAGARLQARGLGLVIAGGEGDRAASQALLCQLPGDVQDLTGRTGLAELATVLAAARLVLSNETGAAHLAAAVGAPVVCVMGGGHYGRFLPYVVERAAGGALPVAVAHRMDCFGCNWHCIHPWKPGEAVKCVRELAMEEVWPQVEACLARPGGDA